jgi:hypothetical protein
MGVVMFAVPQRKTGDTEIETAGIIQQSDTVREIEF